MSTTSAKLETILQNLEKVVLQIPFNRMLGLQIKEIQQNHIMMAFAMKPDLVGNFLYGILHGGVISSVLDMAGGMAAMVSVIHKKIDETEVETLAERLGKVSTIDLQVSYIRPGKGESFTAKAQAAHTGNKISFTTMELFNEQDKLIARGSGTYLIS